MCFYKETESSFVIVAVYVDDINIIGTPEELQKTVDYLNAEFEMKDLGKTRLCLGLQIEHLSDGIFVHQSAYTEKVLKRFYMENRIHLAPQWLFAHLIRKKMYFDQGRKMKNYLVPKYHILVLSAH